MPVELQEQRVFVHDDPAQDGNQVVILPIVAKKPNAFEDTDNTAVKASRRDNCAGFECERRRGTHIMTRAGMPARRPADRHHR